MKLLDSSISGVCSKLPKDTKPVDTEPTDTEFMQSKVTQPFYTHSGAKFLVIEASSRVWNILLRQILGLSGAKLSIIGLNIEC